MVDHFLLHFMAETSRYCHAGWPSNSQPHSETVSQVALGNYLTASSQQSLAHLAETPVNLTSQIRELPSIELYLLYGNRGEYLSIAVPYKQFQMHLDQVFCQERTHL
jgi:hypothetical protein